MHDLNFNTISIDATTTSSLQWQDARKEALNVIAKGSKILWHLELGLFGNLSAPLSNASQFMSLRLALDHFRDTLWEEFKRYSIGASLYQGSPDFSDNYIWDDEQKQNFVEWLNETKAEKSVFLEKIFCRDAGASYLSQLVENVPDRIPLFLVFDGNSIDPLLLLQLTPKDLYQRFTIIFSQANMQDQEASLAICWPLADKKCSHHFESLNKAVSSLQTKGLSYKVISESNLTIEWQGLDHIIYEPSVLTSTGVRKLHGFHAAGGTLVTVGEFLGLSQEISFEAFLELF